MAAAPPRRRCEHDDASYDPTQSSFFFVYFFFVCLFVYSFLFPRVFDHPKNRSRRPSLFFISFHFFSLIDFFLFFLFFPLFIFGLSVGWRDEARELEFLKGIKD